jgi:Tol biopolymer transport system component
VSPRSTAKKSKGTVSPDGRYISFIDYDRHGNLFLHDLSNGTERQTIDYSAGSHEEAEESAFSRDGKQLAYACWKNGHIEIDVVALNGCK